MDDLLGLDACRPISPSSLPENMREVRTPLRWEEWDNSLEHHPDQRFRKYIVDDIRFGFRVGLDYCIGTGKLLNNMVSAGEHPEVVREYLAVECSEGRVHGPLNPALLPMVHTSRFGVIPKGLLGKWRLTVYMSSPE